MGKTGIADALFSRTQQRLLALLFAQAPREFHLNQLLRLAGVGRGAVQRELGRLVETRLVIRTPRGHQVWFAANPDSPVFAELRAIARKTCGLVDVLRETLAPLAAGVELAFVYGSVARGSDHADSDIDLMIVAETISYADVYPLLTDAETTLGRTISPTLYTPAQWRQRLTEANAFVTRVRHLPTLAVIGAAPGDDDVAAAPASRPEGGTA